MDEAILKKVLQLDSLINFLTWQDRTEIHHSPNITSIKVKQAYNWIISTEWSAPKMKYGQDRLLYFFHPDYDCWFVDEDYFKLFPDFKNDLIQLKFSK